MVYPVAPIEAWVLATMRKTGFLIATSRMTASSLLWMAMVWPVPP